MSLGSFRWLAAIFLCLALPATSQVPAASSLSAKDLALLKALVPAMEAAWRSRDARAYASQFTSDAEHINAYGMWWRGRHEIAQAMAFTLEKIYPTNPLQADQVTVKGMGPGMAVVQYRSAPTILGSRRHSVR